MTGPGPHEAAILKQIAEVGWRTVAIEHRGPDGTEVLAMVYFYVCPVCSCTVPVIGEEDSIFADGHRDYHLGMAQSLDEMLAAVLAVPGISQSCSYPDCDVAEGLIAPPPDSPVGFRCPEHAPDAVEAER